MLNGIVTTVCANERKDAEGSLCTAVDEVEALKRKFEVESCSEGVMYTSPSGPVLLLSKKGGEGVNLSWRFRVTGNNSWSVGVIPDSKSSDNEELHERGKVGLDSHGLGGGVMQSHQMHGSWVLASFDSKSSIAKFTVRGETIEQVAKFKGPVRLALSTFNGTKVTMSRNLEEESADCSDQVELEAGAQVKLSDDYADHSDASSGPLKPGDVGTLVKGSGKRYQVQASDGRTWWYDKAAIVSTSSLAGSVL